MTTRPCPAANGGGPSRLQSARLLTAVTGSLDQNYESFTTFGFRPAIMESERRCVLEFALFASVRGLSARPECGEFGAYRRSEGKQSVVLCLPGLFWLRAREHLYSSDPRFCLQGIGHWTSCGLVFQSWKKTDTLRQEYFSRGLSTKALDEAVARCVWRFGRILDCAFHPRDGSGVFFWFTMNLLPDD